MRLAFMTCSYNKDLFVGKELRRGSPHPLQRLASVYDVVLVARHWHARAQVSKVKLPTAGLQRCSQAHSRLV
ncbi:unnamed protein product [Chondrus crispus]|uniref:Uncharacterized protein n=1 Tax=Chondrus crispus TaxID=2769 RepID=R7QC52_CHOCR|nr:unnamed protein product [Chondrus crispus]CDF35373.1 unnamed protein product [Chondrus crispus]|eukprot:XP_005715192.1 unnamed protein product [Chondrus crispus]